MVKDFYIKNRQNLINNIQENSIVVLFAGSAPYKSADEQYPFTPNRNFYYLTGIDRENLVLVLTKRNGEFEEVLFIEESDPIMARWVGERISKDESKDISGIENIDYVKNFEEYIASIISRFGYDNLFLDLERQEWRTTYTLAQDFARDMKAKYPYINIKNIFYDISKLRTIKTEEEINEIRKAISITKMGIEEMMKNAKPNMMEHEIEAYFDFVLRSQGVKDKAFGTIAAAGKNGTILHYDENNSRCMDNELILFDVGAQWNYYNGDLSRTFPVNGKFTERQKQVYNAVLKANEEIIKVVKPGLPFSELNEIAKRVLADGCRELGLIKDDSELSKYYFHGISHYIGLDTHDVGDREALLEPGMVFSNEPGLYIPEEGIGIRIEDDLLVTEDGCENLSKDMIKTVEDIEAFMSKFNKN